jgi:hypothetical protein
MYLLGEGSHVHTHTHTHTRMGRGRGKRHLYILGEATERNECVYVMKGKRRRETHMIVFF